MSESQSYIAVLLDDDHNGKQWDHRISEFRNVDFLTELPSNENVNQILSDYNSKMLNGGEAIEKFTLSQGILLHRMEHLLYTAQDNDSKIIAVGPEKYTSDLAERNQHICINTNNYLCSNAKSSPVLIIGSDHFEVLGMLCDLGHELRTYEVMNDTLRIWEGTYSMTKIKVSDLNSFDF